MSPRRSLQLLRKDLRLGPRSPIFLWALVFPAVATILVQLVFGSLFDPSPRLGIVDLGDSELTAQAQALEGIEVRLLDDPEQLKGQVRDDDLDAGFVVAEGFDQAVRSGEKPLFELYIGGQSLASDRLTLAVTALDLVRQVEGRTPPVDVDLVALGGGESLPIAERMVPLLVMVALVIAGVFVTSFTLVEERERRTLDALLVTPVTITDVLLSKAALGFLLSVLLAYATLLFNGALGSQPVALLLALLAGAVMSVEIGLIYGTAAKDVKALYTLVKTLNILVFAPVIFYLFPDWPQWVARIFPTYWFLDPIFEIAVRDAPLADVWGHLAVSLAISVALVPILVLLGRRMQLRLAAG